MTASGTGVVTAQKTTHPPGHASLFAVTRPSPKTSMSELFSQLIKISAMTKENPAHIAGGYARLARGPGKISPRDFIRLRLFDKALYAGADMREFVGDNRMRDICIAVNYRRDWFGMLSNKVASASYLGVHGLPVTPVKAIYAPYIESDSPPMLGDKSALEDFLLKPEAYPLFGKPTDNSSSLGSIALSSCLPSTREVCTGEGVRIPVKDLVTEIHAHYPTGYLFQKWIAPHPAIAAFSGKHIATVRFLTIAAEDGVQIFRACWKIPSGKNAADNYWRQGNLLAQLEMKSGRIIRVLSGAGIDTREHAVHPDTKVLLIGLVHPQWEEMKALALKGARLMRTVPLIGWDIACTDAGSVIIEMNEYPDAFLLQFADRRGLLDDTFKRFIEFQKQNGALFNAEMKSRFSAIQ